MAAVRKGMPRVKRGRARRRRHAMAPAPGVIADAAGPGCTLGAAAAAQVPARGCPPGTTTLMTFDMGGDPM